MFFIFYEIKVMNISIWPELDLINVGVQQVCNVHQRLVKRLHFVVQANKYLMHCSSCTTSILGNPQQLFLGGGLHNILYNSIQMLFVNLCSDHNNSVCYVVFSLDNHTHHIKRQPVFDRCVRGT